MAVATMLHSDWAAPPGTASALQDVFMLFLTPKPRVVSAMFARTAFARKRRRWYMSSGVKLRESSVNVLSTAKMSVQLWMRAPASGERPFPIWRDGRLGHCADPGCEKCMRRLVIIARGVTQIASRLLDLGSPELVCLLRASRGSDNSRAPHSKRESVETAVRRLVRGPPKRDASVDYWPGQTAQPSSCRVQCGRTASRAVGRPAG